EVTLIAVSFAQMRNQPAGRRRRLGIVSCAAQQLLLGSRASSLDSKHSGHCIDRLLGHVPRSREFASDDGHEAIRIHSDLMVAFDIDRLASRCGCKRPSSGDGTDNIVFIEVGIKGSTCSFNEEVSFVCRAVDLVEAALIVVVGRSQQCYVTPASDRGTSGAARYRNRYRTIIADFGPRHGDMDALGRSDRWNTGIRERTVPVSQPRPGGHDYTFGADT